MNDLDTHHSLQWFALSILYFIFSVIMTDNAELAIVHLRTFVGCPCIDRCSLKTYLKRLLVRRRQPRSVSLITTRKNSRCRSECCAGTQKRMLASDDRSHAVLSFNRRLLQYLGEVGEQRSLINLFWWQFVSLTDLGLKKFGFFYRRRFYQL